MAVISIGFSIPSKPKSPGRMNEYIQIKELYFFLLGTFQTYINSMSKIRELCHSS